MTAKKFFTIFLHTEDEYRNYFGGSNDIRPFAPKGSDTLMVSKDEEQLNIKNGEEFFYGKDLILNEGELDHQFFFIEIEADKKISAEHEANGLLFVIHGLRNDSTITYQTFQFKKEKLQPSNEWIHETHTVVIPNLYQKADKIGLYFWNKERENVELKNIFIRITAPKPY